ncbi:alpha-1,4-glucan--maltose-1-phosphate maltosyltransferase [Demequina zhanjiangensis]|uniref:Alpha-1,4-glucan:maltose-1-phosphate maltosyltransferase n=1 Tax=Demequina zhanjiangensis TaxID=3051659 RepID=A0ABT8FYE1_9MICO|nr:alpha-1,4-glucan--maltose-1-phosphate maltosyltransferase [Demequina sp. SYSU T00b26]MDN4471787.1 alpha-1,4-glucan--maltose-1-phosphate maltosyltransferase [Demequina sp. SYSU T00b26]
MALPGEKPIGRIPVIDVQPTLEQGRWPVKAVVGEALPLSATVFIEGHDAVAATAVVTQPNGRTLRLPMDEVNHGLAIFEALLVPRAEGRYSFRIEGWADPFGTWMHTASKKIPAGVDVEITLGDGVSILERALEDKALTSRQRAVLVAARESLKPGGDLSPAEALDAALTDDVVAVMRAHPVREGVTSSPEYPLVVQRERALVSAWYEIFPRSEGAKQNKRTGEWTSGTFLTASKRLPAIADMGFDVVYLTPIHPIGATHRKGRNNSLTAEPGDPGSPYAIGSEAGGHDAIHPDLGTMRQFRNFVKRAHELGVEVALDIALQCSPDHPWVKEHPEWFKVRADGTIAYAENPPKKYEDIHPLFFDNDPIGLREAIRDVLDVWVDAGVTLFRVDNPHTKPLEFWEWLMADFAERHPEVVFLSEAFTRPPMMHTLAKVGFHQSYTYFTWRPTAEEMGEYLEEVSGDASYYMRPNFWPTTHDILTPDMQHGGAPQYRARAVLAATGSPSYGIYTGYEFVENVPRPGVEEQIDNEKYEYKPRDWSRADDLGIASLLTTLNRTRAAHPALRRLRGLTVHKTSNDKILCFTRHLSAAESPTGEADTVIVVVSFDPHHVQDGVVSLDMESLGMDADARLMVDDALTGATYTWGRDFYVRLDPASSMAHVAAVRR